MSRPQPNLTDTPHKTPLSLCFKERGWSEVTWGEARYDPIGPPSSFWMATTDGRGGPLVSGQLVLGCS